MGGFLYFIPEHITAFPQLAELGLGYAFDRDGRGFYPVQGRGVGGQSGTVIGDERHLPARRITHQAEAQSWRKLPGGENWVGIWTDDPPGPEALIRRDALEGHTVRLADEHDWLIPVARGASEEQGELRYTVRLAQRLELSESGAWRSGGIAPRYAALWNAACAFWDAFVAGTTQATDDGAQVVMEFQAVAETAVLALATNYRVSAAEIALLGLLDEQNCAAVCRALIDWPTIENFLQKKTREACGDSSTAGG